MVHWCNTCGLVDTAEDDSAVMLLGPEVEEEDEDEDEDDNNDSKEGKEDHSEGKTDLSSKK